MAMSLTMSVAEAKEYIATHTNMAVLTPKQKAKLIRAIKTVAGGFLVPPSEE